LSEAAARARGLGKRFLVLRSKRTALAALRAWRGGESLRREKWVLRDVDFEIERGAKVALVGRNGSGKTTLLRLLSGIYSPTCGSLYVPSRPRPLFDCAIGVNQELSVEENVFLFGAVHGLGRGALEARMDELLARAGLSDVAHVPLKDLSTGQAQRLAFSIFAETAADFLILDEVLANVDRGFVEESGRFFRALVDSPRTVIFTSHDADFLATYCAQAMWLDDGRIRLKGDIDRVLREYERSFAAEEEPLAPPALHAARARSSAER
jgi:ABC-type polysaccharide/polyol phosphate transport system ATPase subunit